MGFKLRTYSSVALLVALILTAAILASCKPAGSLSGPPLGVCKYKANAVVLKDDGKWKCYSTKKQNGVTVLVRQKTWDKK
jgi:hypothetical protein